MRAQHKGRFTGSMAIVLAGLALMAGGREAGAQTLTELVSNRMTGSGAGRLVCAACIGESRRGQNDGSYGYLFDKLDVGVSSGTCMPVNGKVEIWAASTRDQRPTMLVRQLSWKSRSDATFTSDSGKKLEPTTRYHVVMLTEGATRFSDTGNGRTTLSDGANPAGVTHAVALNGLAVNLAELRAWWRPTSSPRRPLCLPVSVYTPIDRASAGPVGELGSGD